MHIHIIEDDQDIRRLLEFNLEAEGWRVSSSADGLSGLAALKRERPDFLLLDLMLPGMDGLEICREMKKDDKSPLSAIPIIMVSVRGRESDVVLGLGLGADDYVSKPFGVAELIARIKAVTRRQSTPLQKVRESVIERGPLRLDPPAYKATLAGELLQLTATEFRMLHALAAYPGLVHTREVLKAEAIGDEVCVMDHNIDVHIGVLRKKLGSYRDLIETVWGVGYRFTERN